MRNGLLFSNDFLDDGIRLTDRYKALDDRENNAFRQILARIFETFPVEGTPNEAQTEEDLIRPVLEALGWGRDVWTVQPNASRKGRSEIPDMLLFPDADAKARAVRETRRDRSYLHGVAILESKRWDRPLDRSAKAKRGEEEHEVPSTQILRYLTTAEVNSDGAILWGILTNGRLWRLYYRLAKSKSEEYLELDLAAILGLPGHEDLLAPKDEARRRHWLGVFRLMFGRASFAERDATGRTFHLLALDEGAKWEAKVAQNLSELVFGENGVFGRLVAALDANDPERPEPRNPAYLDGLKGAALTLLYRLLFVLYAEDRDLLPREDRRYDDYGLSRVRDEIARRLGANDALAATIGNYYARLRGLFRAIGKGEPSLGLPPYNGGLFDPRRAPVLERVELPDAVFAPVIQDLSHVEGKRINYRDLSVQQLGSIYERLLEHGVVVRDGVAAVAADERARRGSGSYYTPEVLVQFILERAVGPLVAAATARFKAEALKLKSDQRPVAERLRDLERLDPATALLDLRVCDPAMGSGHFLVSLVDYLSDRVLEAVAAAPRLVPFGDGDDAYVSPLLPRIDAIRTRIAALAEAKRWKLDRDAELDDRRLVRRMVLKRVVFGVDKNPMAVELAKVSLWLHTFTAGAPLSFLDHHLRAGDSLLGPRVADARAWLEARGGVMLHGAVTGAQQAAKAMLDVEAVTDSDIAEVETSRERYADVRDATAALDAYLSIIPAERLGRVFASAPKAKPKDIGKPAASAKAAAAQAAWRRANALNAVLDGSLGQPRRRDRQGAAAAAAPAPRRRAVRGRAGGAAGGAGLPLRPRRPDRRRDQAGGARGPGGPARLGRGAPLPALGTGLSQRLAGLAQPRARRRLRRRDRQPALRPPGGHQGPQTRLGSLRQLRRPSRPLRLLLRTGPAPPSPRRPARLRRHQQVAARRLRREPARPLGRSRLGREPDRLRPRQEVLPRHRRVPLGPGRQASHGRRGPARDGAGRPDPARPRPPRPGVGAGGRGGLPPAAGLVQQAGVAVGAARGRGSPGQDQAERRAAQGVRRRRAAVRHQDRLQRGVPDRHRDDPAAAEIIKPYLRGQDIARWTPRWAGLWMIVMKSSGDRAWPWAEAGEEVFARTYPSLFKHFKQFETPLRKRQDQGRYWWELRPCAYYKAFSQTKIFYQAIQHYPRYAWSEQNLYGNNKTYIISNSNHFMLSVLNSPLFWWYSWRTFLHTKDETLSNDGTVLENAPVGQDLNQNRNIFEDAVSRLIDIHQSISDMDSLLRDWYAAEHGIEKPGNLLSEPFNLTPDAFVEAVRARVRGGRLSAAAVRAVRDEHAATVRPAADLLREAEALERRLSDTVNEAYGLTPEEVALMWRTAPPRTPLAPKDTASGPEATDDEAA